jgi:pimeloyl-ACP methyl ester carboxylesterase
MTMPRLLGAADRLAHFAMTARRFESRFVDAGTDGVRVHVYDGRGNGSLPPVVLVHGLSAAGSSFARVAEHLIPHVKRVVIPELVGHGRSEHPGKPISPDLLLAAMTASLDALIDEDEPAILYGNSLGGAVALTYAVRRPERVRGLVLVSPAGARLLEDEWKQVRETFDVKDRRSARRFLERIYHRPPWFLALVAHEFPDIVKRRAVRELLESATPEHGAAIEEVAALPMPILLLWGRSDRLFPPAALAWFRNHLPRHAVVEEPIAFGHAPQIEQPELVADRIVRFARTSFAHSSNM